MMSLFCWTILLLLLTTTTNAYEWSARSSRIHRQALAGVWKVVSQPPPPLKEFTVRPQKQSRMAPPPLVLHLCEDGSFQQYHNDDEQDESRFDLQAFCETRWTQVVAGIWDYRDGKLLLAADRKAAQSPAVVDDALLEGRVTHGSTNETLTVPLGHVQIGRFMYPKKHPSFFEQPMFRPERQPASFQLRQVLTSYVEREPIVVERFQRSDLYNKTFSLTSHPIRMTKQDQPVSIRAIQLQFFANNTFATIAGVGETILRGKFDIVGHNKDQLWMQVTRFGFGRSVSGSVYSEGRMLTNDDAKSYWGDILSEKNETMIVEGSVLIGLGLEPTPVARFLMKETTDLLEGLEEDDEDDEEEELRLPEMNLNDDDGVEEDGIDWTGNDGFQ